MCFCNLMNVRWQMQHLMFTVSYLEAQLCFIYFSC